MFPNNSNISEIRIHSPIELSVLQQLNTFFLNLFYRQNSRGMERQSKLYDRPVAAFELDPECRAVYFITFPLQNSLLGSRIQRQDPAIVKVFTPSKAILTEKPKMYKNILSGITVQSCVFQEN